MKILDQEENLLAYIIRFEDIKEGKNFITSNDAEFQLASFNLSDDTVIERHYHPKQERKIKYTNEVLIVLDGELEVDIYDNEKNHIQTVNLKSLDTIALIDGGHGISFNSQTKFIEVKQGPYNEKTDKKRF
jgi:cupin fold WbuC family metalloprotein|tara:strand:- start:2184 stop:2576 length:393 start_codon:yes stop_codon:yes gene_type:complete